MKIGTILFTYHRYNHTKKVLEALSQNDILPEKLYVFQDGVKGSTNIEEWRAVNKLIQNIKWCNIEVHVSTENKGLAKSIVTGIDFVMKECDAAIILEDDCVPHKQFMSFMLSALNTYQFEKKVYSISGYAWDVEVHSQRYDAYFSGRNCSYGWGTWKDRWSQYEEDYRILTKIKQDPEACKRLNTWGSDLPSMVTGNVLGKCNSWAVFWGLKIIEKGGYCLSPYKQMIQNVGFDGSGEHCGNLQQNMTGWEDEILKPFSFPRQIECDLECQEEFQFKFSGKSGEEKMKLYQDLLIQWIRMKQQRNNMRIPYEWGDSIAVWGKGKVFDCFVSELENRIPVKYIIESRPGRAEYDGIPVIPANALPNDVKDIVVIPFFDMDIIKRKMKKLKPDARLWGVDELLYLDNSKQGG